MKGSSSGSSRIRIKPAKWMFAQIIAGPESRSKTARGVALKPGATERIIADIRQNALLSCFFPDFLGDENVI
ncbi:MAG: hypothetical protein A3H94_04120 [Acidobacteria bacterium RIFCSPLOWO2_02_FULL_60_20]|nr:MAG: hypothetical protein A3H94_04120 [Acidobacteria bacterium RIFCSPLOWO2_02_FULL_60_20]